MKMNKELVGKWFSQEELQTLNIIEDGEGFRIKMSFETSGYYNFKPNCFYIKEEFLFYEINDEINRCIYKIRLEENYLKGTYTQFDQIREIVYEKVSDIPEDGQFYYMAPKINVSGIYKTRIEILKQYSVYSNEERLDPYKIEYTLNGPIPVILEKYNYDDYVKGHENICDELVFSLLDFVCDNFQHNGYSNLPQERSIESIIEYCHNNGNKINCRGLAILLASVLRLNGIKAAHITCMPYENPFSDCHVVVECLLPSGAKVMLDPTYRLFLVDKNQSYVSLSQLRRMLINDEEYVPNKNASYNGGIFDLIKHREYMTKNTFRFSRGVKAYNGCEDGRGHRRIELIPLGYQIDDFNEKEKSEFVYNDDSFWQ